MRRPFDGDYPLTQKFGVNPDFYKQWNLKGHNGLDYALPTGTAILTPHSGVVIEAAFDPNGYGNYVKVENDREGSTLAHLEQIKVKVGQKLNESDLVGTSDNTGYSTGPHLHWGYFKKPRNRGNGFDGYTDQLPILTASAAPVSGQLYTEEQYKTCMADRNKFWEERDAKIKEIEQLGKEIIELKAKLSAFQSAGYETAESVLKVVEQRDKNISGLKNELLQVLDRNKVLAGVVEKKEIEDATAIQTGIDAAKELEDLKDSMNKIHKTVGLTPVKGFEGLWQLLERIKWFKKEAKRAEILSTSPSVAPPPILDPPITAKEAPKDLAYWAKVFGLISGIVLGITTPLVFTLL